MWHCDKEYLPHYLCFRVPPVVVCKYVDQKGSAAMLGFKGSAGVAQEVNLRNPLHTGKKAPTQGIHLGLETQGWHHQKSKTGIPVVLQKD